MALQNAFAVACQIRLGIFVVIDSVDLPYTYSLVVGTARNDIIYQRRKGNIKNPIDVAI
jgi:hypothetical protein